MPQVAVIGSGPSGIAAATILLEGGADVDLYDGGREPEREALQRAEDLRRALLRPGTDAHASPPNGSPSDSLRGTLSRLRGELSGRPGADRIRKRLFGSDFVFAGAARDAPTQGLELPQSLAVGGLSNAWGAACYPFSTADLRSWPIALADLEPWYRRASRMLGLSLRRDPLAMCYGDYGQPAPAAAGMGPPLLSFWRRREGTLRAAGIAAGAARLAVAEGAGSAKACLRCGHCLHGCPTGAIWTAREGLQQLRAAQGLRHRAGFLAHRLEPDGHGLRLVWRRDGTEGEAFYDAAFLAAGPLNSARIAGASLQAYGEPMPLLDSDLHIVPLRLGKHARNLNDGIALSRAVVHFTPGTIMESGVHLQLYAPQAPLLGAAGELLARLPSPLRHAFLRRLAIGMLFFDSTHSRGLEMRARAAERGPAILDIRETAASSSAVLARRTLAHIAAYSASLGLRPFGRLAVAMPPGASFHLGGSLPMRSAPARLQTGPDGRLAGIENCYVVDSATFPTMPAQNPTLTIMANAMRIAAGFLASRQG